MRRVIRWMLVFGLIGGFVRLAEAQSLDPANQLARDIFKQLIEINTTDSVGNVTTAAEAMAQRLRAAGFSENDLHVAGPNDRKKNLVVRLRSKAKTNPILLIGYFEIGEALAYDRTIEPEEFNNKESF